MWWQTLDQDHHGGDDGDGDDDDDGDYGDGDDDDDDGDDDDGADGAGGKHRSMVTAHCSRKSLEKTAGRGRSCFW